MKTIICNTCEKYCHVKVPSKQKKIISNLSNRRKDIVFLKQDKGRGIVIMGQIKYIEKCLSLLSSNRFVNIGKQKKKKKKRKKKILERFKIA